MTRGKPLQRELKISTVSHLEQCFKIIEVVGGPGKNVLCYQRKGSVKPDLHTPFIPMILWILVTQ